MLEADFALVSSPWALRIRLLIAAVLGILFLAIGLAITARLCFSFFDGTLNDFGSPIGPGLLGLATIAIGAAIVAAGWATLKGYRSRGLL
jgi:hypothetical protein